MNVRCLRRLLPWLTILAVLLPSGVRAAADMPDGPESAIHIGVDDVEAGSLAVFAANRARQDLVFGAGPRQQRVSMTLKANSKPDLVKQLAQRLHASLQWHDGVALLRHACTPEGNTNLPATLTTDKLTLHFQRIGLLPLIDVLRTHSSLDLTSQPAPGEARIVSTSLIKRPMKSLLEVLAIAGGAHAREASPGKLSFTVLPRPQGCGANDTSPPLVEYAGERGHCFGGTDPNAQCELLERYPLASLRLKGFVLQAGKCTAAVETPDQMLWHVEPGNHMGQGFGKVASISARGIEVLEPVWKANLSLIQRPVWLRPDRLPAAVLKVCASTSTAP